MVVQGMSYCENNNETVVPPRPGNSRQIVVWNGKLFRRHGLVPAASFDSLLVVTLQNFSYLVE
jgi:hypothetical protein